MEQTRRAAQSVIDALNSADQTGSEQVANALQLLHEEHAADNQLARRTTALRAAAEVTAGMSDAEVQTDHDSRTHDPDRPVANVIALAGEFEDWLSRPAGAPATSPLAEAAFAAGTGAADHGADVR